MAWRRGDGEDGGTRSRRGVRRRRDGRRRGLLPIAVGSALVLLAGYLAVDRLLLTEGSQCAVTGSELRLDLEQAGHAATISAVAESRRLPERALTIALATAMQESELRNIGHGDRDSIGLFQQRPSQGWGTAEQIADPVYSTERFFDGLVKVRGYARLPLTVAAQRVQLSGHPQAYAKHEAKAAALAAAFSGREAAAFRCGVARGDAADEGAGSADAGEVAAAVREEFGERVARGEAAGDGRSVGFPVGAVTEEQSDSVRTGWALAHWAVAHTGDLGITSVRFDGREWRRGGAGWRPYEEGAGTVPGVVRIGTGG